MIRAHTRRESGFTIFEVIIVASLAALGLLTVTSLFGSNLNMVDESRANQRAEQVHRRNMAALVRVLRGIDIQSLDGFDANDRSSAPYFSRVTGADLDDFTYAGSEQLVWLRTPGDVDGVAQPGAVYLVRGGLRTLVADRVPAGGFEVRREGRRLTIDLKSYYVTNRRRLVYRKSSSAVSVRN